MTTSEVIDESTRKEVMWLADLDGMKERKKKEKS